MKLQIPISPARRSAGILLTECLVYISVFFILSGIAFATFYFCWDHTRMVVGSSTDVENTLRAGERWRADIRNATGPVTVETAADGETVRIPEAGKEIDYHFHDGEVRRQLAAQDFSELLLSRVKSSAVKADTRGTINAWRWEVEVSPLHQKMNLPLLFTFEAVQPRS